MEPGLSSLFSGFELNSTQLISEESIPFARYSVSHWDEHFGKDSVPLSAFFLIGQLETFYRPLPVEQLRISSALRLARKNESRG